MGLHTDLCKKIPAYNEWHQNQHHKKVHWFLFLLVVALVFIFLFTQTQNVVKAFDAEEIGGEPISTMSIEEMNQQIITLSNMLATVAPNKKQIVIQEIIQLSKIRKEEVRKIINAGEVSIDSLALPDAIRGVMPEAARSFVEQKKKISGKFTWIHSHSDEPNAKPSKNDFSITEPSGKVHTIKYQKNVIPKYRTDDTVTLTGYEFDNLFVALEGGTGGSGGTDGLQTQTAVTTKKIAVVFV